MKSLTLVRHSLMVSLAVLACACGGQVDFGDCATNCPDGPTEPAPVPDHPTALALPQCDSEGTCGDTGGGTSGSTLPSQVPNNAFTSNNTNLPPSGWTVGREPGCPDGWNVAFRSSTVADPQTGSGWSLHVPPRSPPAYDTCAFTYNVTSSAFGIPSGTSKVRVSFDALRKNVSCPSCAASFYFTASVQWFAADCTTKTGYPGEILGSSDQLPGANPATNDFGTYTYDIWNVPAGTLCAKLRIATDTTSSNELYLDNAKVTPL